MQNILALNLAKVGVEGSNPFARSIDIKRLADVIFAAEGSTPAFRFASVLIGTVLKSSENTALPSALSRCGLCAIGIGRIDVFSSPVKTYERAHPYRFA